MLELRVCRGCLATDIRLYEMRQNRLMEAYSTLLSTDIQEADNTPHYLCSYCATLLLKCDTFRKKCIDTQVTLKNVQISDLELTMAKIKQIACPTYFRQSYNQTITIDDNIEKLNNQDTIFETVKVEFNNDTNNSIDSLTDNAQINALLEDIFNSDKNQEVYCVNNLIQDFKVYFDSTSNVEKYRMDQLANIISHIQYLSNANSDLLKVLEAFSKRKFRENTRKNRMETTVSKARTKMKLEDKLTKPKSVNNAIYDGTKNCQNKNDPDIADDEFEKSYVLNSDTDDEVAIAELKINSKSSKCKITTPNVNDVTKDCKAIKNSKPNTNKKERTRNVSKLYDMNEIDLSKEEQLKEIEDRKNSDSYLQAQFKCNFCYKGFRIEESFKCHMVMHDDKSGKYVCDLCHCHFINSTRLKKHRYNHKKRFSCKVCTYATKYVSQAREHHKWHSGVKDKCKHCGKECSGQSSYYLHLKMYHPTSEELLRCEICGESCSGSLGLKIHEKRAHKEMFSPECYCCHCERQFYSSDAFKTHQGSDGACDPRAKPCVRCGMSFITDELLKEHELDQRKPRNSFKCEVCQKKFTGHTSLKKHQLQHALTLTRHVICEICGKILSNQHCLKQHYLNKHSTETPFKCTECPKSFRCALNLQLHIRTHTGERPYKCTHCPKAFKSCANMKRHELVHTGERPHSCNICGKSFQTTHNVKAHIKSVHNQIRRPPSIRRRNKKN